VRRPAESGIATVEVVVLAPVLVIFMLFVVALGLIVDAKGQVAGAARDAARAGSLQRGYDAAVQVAQDAAAADLGRQCQGGPALDPPPPGEFVAGGLFTVQVRCNVSLRGLNLLGLGPAKTITERASAPLDTFRRTGGP
jgi:Flp pilus assembly protein TadG